jgi:hypothetical protein
MYIADDIPAANSLRESSDGIIELTLTGHQTKQSSQEFANDINDLVLERRKKKQHALILVDLTGVTGHDVDVREASRETMKNDYDGLALFGENMTVRMLANWLIRTTGQGDRVRFFDTKEEAVEWLGTR